MEANSIKKYKMSLLKETNLESFPEINPELFTPIFTSYCIDYRYDALSSNFLKGIGYANSYYLSTNAGSSLSLGYKKYCKNNCDDDKNYCHKDEAMDILKKSFITNLKIALTLKPIMVVYLLNHQDCGAIRAFLPGNIYPSVGEDNKKEEIRINASLLTYGQAYIKKKFEHMEVYLGLIDSNGTVGDYDIKTKQWSIIYVGLGQNQNGLWYGFKKDDIY